MEVGVAGVGRGAMVRAGAMSALIGAGAEVAAAVYVVLAMRVQEFLIGAMVREFR